MAMQTISIDTDARGVVTVTLNRADVHNPFNAEMIEELTETFEALGHDDSCRVIVLTGAGKSFSAGADINWMRDMRLASEEENRLDSLALARLLRAIDFVPKPVIARVNGHAFGGGVGLISCCDIAIGASHAKFGLTEVKLGLLPAVISPYVVRAIGARQARRLFLTAELFGADTAHEIGLLHSRCELEALDAEVDRQVELLLGNGPNAVATAKTLVPLVTGFDPARQGDIDQATAALIAAIRVSDEGQEGLTAFLDKRKPSWHQ